MEMKRSSRTALLSLLSVGIALGGFYTGYAKSDPHQVKAREDIQPTYFGRLPINLNYSVMLAHGPELGITPSEVEKVRKACDGVLKEYLAAQKEDYDVRFRRSQLAEEGKIMTWSGLPGASTVDTLRQVEKDEKPLTEAWAKFSFKVASALGKEKNAKVVAKINQLYAWGNSPAHAKFLLDTAIVDKLELTPAQKNQLILVTSSNALVASDPAAKLRKPVEFDQVAPKIDEYRKTLHGAAPGYKLFFFAQASALLSPMQRFRLDTIIRNAEYVQP